MTSHEVTMPGNTDTVGGNARISDDGLYRYYLTRYWDKIEAASDRVCWVMLNPSTADASVDDPTIRRCKAFSKAWGFGGMAVVNVFALRATDPKELKVAEDPVGPWNDEHIDYWLSMSDLVVAAWGTSWPGRLRPRIIQVTGMLLDKHPSVRCLRTSKSGQPVHPLYQPKSLIPVRWP